MNKEAQAKTYTCIVCPKGCEITAKLKNDGELTTTGASCSKGEDYVRKEMLDPRRILTTSVLVCQGEEPLVSVRTQAAIPRRQIGEIMALVRQLKVNAPIAAGQVIMANIGNTDTDLVATKDISLEK